jgi:nitroreductase
VNLTQAIEERRSRRKYSNTPIDFTIVSKLKRLINEYSKQAGLRIELVLNNGKAFNGFRKSYGMFSGVNDYIGLIADKSDKTAAERLGYYGELLTLHAVSMGLGTCWVGGTFSRSDTPFTLADGEALICVIVIGNADKNDSFKEKLIRNLTHRKSKTAQEMFVSDCPAPDWFMRGMDAVQKAPSAINRQPVMFSYSGGNASAPVRDISDNSMVLDFGIAKLHFEIGAGGGEWDWGNNAAFIRNSGR